MDIMKHIFTKIKNEFYSHLQTFRIHISVIEEIFFILGDLIKKSS